MWIFHNCRTIWKTLCGIYSDFTMTSSFPAFCSPLRALLKQCLQQTMTTHTHPEASDATDSGEIRINSVRITVAHCATHSVRIPSQDCVQNWQFLGIKMRPAACWCRLRRRIEHFNDKSWDFWEDIRTSSHPNVLRLIRDEWQINYEKWQKAIWQIRNT